MPQKGISKEAVKGIVEETLNKCVKERELTSVAQLLCTKHCAR